MKDIFLKRNELRTKSVHLREYKFDPELKDNQSDKIAEQQNKLYNQWKFYDSFLKAREVVKNEVKPNNMGKDK